MEFRVPFTVLHRLHEFQAFRFSQSDLSTTEMAGSSGKFQMEHTIPERNSQPKFPEIVCK